MTYAKYFAYLGIKSTPVEREQFIMRLVKQTVDYREKNNVKRNDFMNLLLEMKNAKDENGASNGWSIEQIAAQVFIFFIAGFETSSSNTSYALFELAQNPKVQQKLRAEIEKVLQRHDGELSYEAMMEMKYLDQVITGMWVENAGLK